MSKLFSACILASASAFSVVPAAPRTQVGAGASDLVRPRARPGVSSPPPPSAPSACAASSAQAARTAPASMSGAADGFVPDMQRRTIMNLVLLGGAGVPVLWCASAGKL